MDVTPTPRQDTRPSWTPQRLNETNKRILPAASILDRAFAVAPGIRVYEAESEIHVAFSDVPFVSYENDEFSALISER
jgi:hypothetical protein